MNIVETQDVPDLSPIPIADNTTLGIASFNVDDFAVQDGMVSSIMKAGIPQYLGNIIGKSSEGHTLNWHFVEGSIKPTLQVRIGEYVMLAKDTYDFKAGEIFKISKVASEESAFDAQTSDISAASISNYTEYLQKVAVIGKTIVFDKSATVIDKTIII